MTTEIVLYECRNQIAWVTMNRPVARNALSQKLRDGLRDGFNRFVDDKNARVMVLAGAGPIFCAGGDLKEMAATELKVPGTDFVPYLNRTVHTDKPTIAMVQGGAYAGGFLLAQMCDLVVTEPDAKFAITEARWGRGAPWAAPLSWLIPPRIALELLVTATPISAERAYQIGLVNRVVPRNLLYKETEKFATQIARNAPLSVCAGKSMVYATLGEGFMEALEHGEQIFKSVYLSEDAQEGPKAFREKRDPQWKGR